MSLKIEPDSIWSLRLGVASPGWYRAGRPPHYERSIVAAIFWNICLASFLNKAELNDAVVLAELIVVSYEFSLPAFNFWTSFLDFLLFLSFLCFLSLRFLSLFFDLSSSNFFSGIRPLLVDEVPA
jgi:hypothetical protein